MRRGQEPWSDEEFLIQMFPRPLEAPASMDSFGIELGRAQGEHIWATVKSVELEHHGEVARLGPFKIGIDLRRAQDGLLSSVTIRGKHPHISDTEPCWGNLYRGVVSALTEKDWQAVLDLCKVFLNTYYPKGAYWRLFDEACCSHCEQFYSRDELIFCDACEESLCVSCVESVQTEDGLGAYVCPVCYEQEDLWCVACRCYIAARETEFNCHDCGARLHQECAHFCDACENPFCPNCTKEVKGPSDWMVDLCADCAENEELFCPECDCYVGCAGNYCGLCKTYVHASCWEQHLKGEGHEQGPVDSISDKLEDVEDNEGAEKETVFISASSS